MRTDLLYNKMNQKKKNSATLNFKRVEKKTAYTRWTKINVTR